MKRMAQEGAREPEMSRKGLGHDEGTDELKPVIQSRKKDRQRGNGQCPGSERSKVLQIFQSRRRGEMAFKTERK